MGTRALRSIRLGLETTAGTAVAATTYWRGSGTLEDQREIIFPEEDISFLMRSDRSYAAKLGAAINLDAIPATFEQLPYLLTSGIKALTTGAADSTGSGKVYAYTIPTSTANSISTFTIEGGDDTAQEEMEYAFCESFTLEGNAGEALMMSANMIGRQVSTSAWTTTATLPTVEEIMVSSATFAIDTAGGTAGTTLVSSTLKGINLSVTTGWKPQWTADGALYFGTVAVGIPEITLEATMLYNASAVSEVAAWRAQTARLIQLKFAGTALTTAGNYTTKTLKVVLVGKWAKFGKIDEDDGVDVISGTFNARYNSTAAQAGAFTVVNNLTSLP